LFDVLIFFFQAEDGIRDFHVTGVQTCALPIYAAHRLQSIGENPLPATVSWMFIRPLRLPSDRAAVSEFLHEQARRGLPGLSENKHALIEYDGDRPGTGLVAEGQDAGVVAYVGLAPAADGYWAMEIVTSQPDPRPLVAASVETVGERRSRG